MSLVQPSFNRESEGIGFFGSDGFFRKIGPQADGRGEEGRVVGASNLGSLDALEGVSSEYSGLSRQNSLSGLDLDLAPLDLIHQGGQRFSLETRAVTLVVRRKSWTVRLATRRCTKSRLLVSSWW